MISVVIPTLNEAATIAAVVAFARRSPEVGEVIVVDDGSLDDTQAKAGAAGARVLTSSMLGKGVSLQEGLAAAANEVVLYLDGDLAALRGGMIEAMTRPVRDGDADFVKARFSRRAGRVTALTARPLLRIFFPELAHIEQPLGGILAARGSLLRQLRFESDYGVDIGLLVDAAMQGATIMEVDIGHIEHTSQPLAALEEMAGQVARTLLDRAVRYRRFSADQLDEALEAEQEAQADLPALRRRVGSPQRLALFDMDGVLVQGRFVAQLARRTNRTPELAPLLDNPRLSAEDRARRIAALFAGVPRRVFEETAGRLPLTEGAAEVVVALRRAGYRVGIVTDSYRTAAEVVRRRVFADFCVAHRMSFQRGRATGQLMFAPAMSHEHGCTAHRLCKLNVWRHLREWTNLGSERVLAIGDGENDVCLLGAAGRSVAFQPKAPCVASAASHSIHGNLLAVLDHLGDDLAPGSDARGSIAPRWTGPELGSTCRDNLRQLHVFFPDGLAEEAG